MEERTQFLWCERHSIGVAVIVSWIRIVVLDRIGITTSSRLHG